MTCYNLVLLFLAFMFRDYSCALIITESLLKRYWLLLRVLFMFCVRESWNDSDLLRTLGLSWLNYYLPDMSSASSSLLSISSFCTLVVVIWRYESLSASSGGFNLNEWGSEKALNADGALKFPLPFLRDSVLSSRPNSLNEFLSLELRISSKC